MKFTPITNVPIEEIYQKLKINFPEYQISINNPMGHKFIVIKQSNFCGARVGIVDGVIHCIKYIPFSFISGLIGIFIWPFYSKKMGIIESRIYDFLVTQYGN